jgi:PAS domain S-box-containing protein
MIRTLTYEQKDALLTTLWDRSLVGVALVTKEGRFEFANEAFCRLLEYSETELRNRHFQEITHPDDVHADVSMARDITLREADEYTMRKRYITKTGKVVWMILHVQGLIVSNELHYFVSQISEIVPVLNVDKLLPKRTTLSTHAFRFVKENLAWIVLTLSGFAYILAEVLKSLDEGSK